MSQVPSPPSFSAPTSSRRPGRAKRSRSLPDIRGSVETIWWFHKRTMVVGALVVVALVLALVHFHPWTSLSGGADTPKSSTQILAQRLSGALDAVVEADGATAGQPLPGPNAAVGV